MQHPKAVLLDRDGVVNFDSPDYILAPEQWIPIPGSLEAIARLHRAGIRIALCSNQSGLGRGMMSGATFETIHAKMMLAVEEAGGRFDYVAYCPHNPDDDCRCRKPKPGMVFEILRALDLSPDQTLLIGDSARDVEAAAAAGVPAILVQSGYGDAAKILAKAEKVQPGIAAYPDLATAIDALLGDAA